MLQWNDPRLVSAEPFVPHSYAFLTETRNFTPQEISEERYLASQERFHAIKDVVIRRITYRCERLRITGAMLLPASLSPASCPILIYNRGGNGNFGILSSLVLTRLADYARAGFIVFASNYRGNDGSEGKDEWGGADVQDVLELLSIARTHPAWDGRNMFMYGHSRGGMMTFLAIRNGAKLNAAVCVAGPTDPLLLGKQRADMLAMYRHRIPQFDERQEAVFADRSALAWAEKLDVPLLLLQGDNDTRVDAAHTLALDAELTRLGKPHKTVIYPGGDHSLSCFRKESREEILAWFKQFSL